MYYTATLPIAGTILYKVEGDQITTFPTNADNTDYQQYLAWVEEGNQPIQTNSIPPEA